MPRSADLRCVALLLGVSVLLWLPRLRGPIDLRFDAGVYYITGTALAEGKGYRLLNEPGEIQAVQYPPLLPALVAAHQWALGTGDPVVVAPWLRRSYCLMFSLYLLAVYGMARRFLAAWQALFVGLICAVHPPTIWLSDLLFAELPFALVTVLFVLLNRKNDQPIFFALAALCATTAFLLRTAGVALMAAWVGEAFLRRQWGHAAARAAVVAVPIVAWQGYVACVTATAEYRLPAYPYQRAPYQYSNVTYAENMALLDPFIPERGRVTRGALARRFLRNFLSLKTELGKGVGELKPNWFAAFGVRAPRVIAVLLVGTGCLILGGVGILLARREWFLPSYIALAVGLMCATPWPGQFFRYLMPLTPFLVLCLVLAWDTLRHWCRSRWPTRWWLRAWSAAPVLLMAAILAAGAKTNFEAFTFPGRSESNDWGNRLMDYDGSWAEFDTALAWVKDHAEPGDVIATNWPHQAYLQTGLKAVLPPLELDPAQAQRLLDSVPVRYLILDRWPGLDLSRKYASTVVWKNAESWRLVCTKPGGTRIYCRAD